MSPLDDGHDLGKAVFRIQAIFSAFRNRSKILLHRNFQPGESLLKVLINPDGSEFPY